MAKIFFPSCQTKIAYPDASEKLREYFIANYSIETVVGCCRKGNDRANLSPEDTAIIICFTCFAACEQFSNAGKTISVWEIIDSDNDFPFPNYNGEKITVQDCWRAVGRDNIHNAVRSLLKKMNVEPVELNENRSKSRFCGSMSAYMQQSVQNTGNPLRAGRLEERGTGRTGIFKEHSEEDRINFIKKHTEQFTTDRVVSYCIHCDDGIKIGDKKSVSLLNLIFKIV
jgi:hypothetical protein